MDKKEKDTLDQPKVEEEKDIAQETPVEEQPIVEEAPKEEAPKAEEEKPVEDAVPEDTNKDEPIVIDNTVAPPTQPIQDLPRTAKIKEPMSKQKKITILVASIVAFIAIFSIVFFPLFFCYIQGRIHVYNADDFQAQAGKRFVLEKDIVVEGDLNLAGAACSIDLNGHNLTVDGTLTLGKDETTLEVGTLKKGAYTAKGTLTVNALNVTGGDLNFASSVLSKTSVTVSANKVTFNGLSLVTEGSFIAKDIVFAGPLTVSSETTVIGFENCESVKFNAEVGASTTYFVNSNAELNAGATAKGFDLDENSTLQAYGTLTSVSGGKKVAMLQGHTCSKYEGIKTLAIYEAFKDEYSVINCDTVVYLETLPTPVDFYVKEDDSRFYAYCAKVNSYDGVKYKFYLDSQVCEDIDGQSILSTNYVDITKQLSEAGAATHKLEAYALGNYDFATLDTTAYVSGTTLYLDCITPATIEYTYTLKLATPKKAEAKKESDGNVYLYFADVEFADYYVATIDGTTKYILTNLSKETFEQKYSSVAAQYANNIIQYTKDGLIKAPITEQISTLGYHSIRLVASSFSKEIETSKETMASYKTTKPVTLTEADITAVCTEIEKGKYETVITISNCEEGKVFKLTINGEDIRLSNTKTYTYTSTTSLAGSTVTVVAEAYGYYEATAQTVTIVAA